jgi:hypothetical protein
MQLIKGFALVILAIVAIALGTALIALSPKMSNAQPIVKALPSVQFAGYLMPSKEAKPEYSKMTIRQLKALAKGTGIKRWEKLNKSQLVEALDLMS